MPYPRQVARQPVNAGAIVRTERPPLGLGATPIRLFGVGEPRQCLVPLSLEAIGDQAMFGAHQQKLLLGQLCLLPGTLDLRATEPIDLRLARS
jgi:hypothetical protein